MDWMLVVFIAIGALIVMMVGARPGRKRRDGSGRADAAPLETQWPVFTASASTETGQPHSVDTPHHGVDSHHSGAIDTHFDVGHGHFDAGHGGFDGGFDGGHH